MELAAAEGMARELMERHGLDGWGFGFDRAKVRAGACHFRDRRITLSAAVTQVHDEAMVRETVLHEVAHALVGPRHGHDAAWRSTARRIGATGDRCYSADEPAVPGRWQGRCEAGHVVHRHRRPTGVYLCGRCGAAVPRRERALRWELDGVPVPPEALGPQVAAAWAALEGGDGPAAGDADPAAGLHLGRGRAGDLVRIVAPGRYHGLVGRVVRRGRTRYLVQVRGGRLHVPFGLAEPLSARPGDAPEGVVS